MYQHIISIRVLLSAGFGFLIFSLVFGWVSFSVPDWLQYHERNRFKTNNLSDEDFSDFKKFGLWHTCTFSSNSNDFICTVWNNDAPSFVRVAQVLIPFGLIVGCLSLVATCIGFMCRQCLVTTLLFAALFAFLNFIFITIGITVFASESLVYVDRLRLNVNKSPRRWGMWLLIPNLILSFFTSMCFIAASLLYWWDYRSMEVTGILSHSGDKYNGSVCKLPSDSNITSGIKRLYPYGDYSNACNQLNGLNNNQQNPMSYPPPPTYAGAVNPIFQPTSDFFGYSRTGSPTTNQAYPQANLDSHYPRTCMTEDTEIDESSRTSRSHRRSHSRRHASHRSRSHSSSQSTTTDDNNQKQMQFVPIPIPYYQPQPTSLPQPTITTKPAALLDNPTPISYIVPPTQKHYVQENIQPTTQIAADALKYGAPQATVLVSNPTPPICTIAYRANNTGDVVGPTMFTGPAATTYVTANPNQRSDFSSLNSNFDIDNRNYATIAKRKTSKKMSINEAWTWHKMQ